MKGRHPAQKTAVFDARWVLPTPSGIGVYARELALRLPALMPQFRFVFLVRRDAPTSFVEALRDAGGIVRPIAWGPLSAKNQILLPALLRSLGAALYHTPNYMVPLAATRRGGGARTACVATVHDAIPLVVPDYAPASRTARMKGVFRFLLRQAALRSDALLTVSETSRRDIVRALNLPPGAAERFRAVPNGVDDAFFAAAGERQAPPCDSDRKTTRTLLCVGRFDPYKNVTMLVEAFAAARASAPFPLRLVVAGAQDPRYPEALAAAARLGLADSVEFAGAVPFARLVELYRSADLLVQPSRYEGFGLQVAEAFAAGTPVLCSDGGALPEIAGDAARVEPLSGGADAWGRRIVALLSNGAALGRMREAGLRRARAFTWARAAREIADIALRAAAADPASQGAGTLKMEGNRT